MGFGDFLKGMLGLGPKKEEGQGPSQTTPPPAQTTPVGPTTPAPATATPGSGGMRSAIAGSGPSHSETKAIEGAHPGGDQPMDPRMLELLEDRKKAQAELKDRFQVMTPEQLKLLGDKALPNQVSQADFEKLATTYSDIRMGESNLKLDTAGMDPTKADEFKKGSMNDIASLLQTGSGRELISQLDEGIGKDGKEHTTSIGSVPARAAFAGASDPAKEDLRQTTGTDMEAKYQPGASATIGDPKKEPWYPQRSDVTLMHELTHALHGVKGTTQEFTPPPIQQVIDHKINDMPTPTLNEEWATVGLGQFANDPITENKYREERRKLAGQVGARPGDEGPHMVRREHYASWG